MQLREDARQLPVLGQRPGQARDPDHAGIGGDEQDRRGQQTDVVLGEVQDRAVQSEPGDDPEHRIVLEEPTQLRRVAGLGEVFAQRRAVADPVVDDRQRRQRDDRDAGVDAEHRDHHEVDRLRDLAAGSRASSAMFATVSIPV